MTVEELEFYFPRVSILQAGTNREATNLDDGARIEVVCMFNALCNRRKHTDISMRL